MRRATLRDERGGRAHGPGTARASRGTRAAATTTTGCGRSSASSRRSSARSATTSAHDRSATRSPCSSAHGRRARASGSSGKNGLLIVPGVGSFVLLGEVVTTLAIDPDPPIPERCGACTRCLDACPTNAFDAPFVLDPRRCISYLTIEQRAAIAEALRADVGEHLFGCDECQTVCPFNARAARATSRSMRASRSTRDGRRRRSRISSRSTTQGFVRLREGSPVGRATRVGLARNAAVVLGNRGDAAALAPRSSARDRSRRPDRPRGSGVGDRADQERRVLTSAPCPIRSPRSTSDRERCPFDRPRTRREP